MKPTIRVSIGGIAFNLDEDAYKLLFSYLEALKSHFAKNEESEEIITDIEQRLSELLSMRVNSSNGVVSEDDAQDIINIMGSPKDFGDQGEGQEPQTEPGASIPPFQKPVVEKEKLFDFRSKKLYRDTEERIIGGVCGGLGHYLRFDPVVIRIIFVLLFIAGLLFSNPTDEVITAIIFTIYLVLWVVTPKASTFEDKLRMTGGDPSIYNIEDRNRKVTRRSRGSGIVEIIRGGFKVILIMAIIVAILALVGTVVFFGWLNFETEVFAVDNYLILMGLDGYTFKTAMLLLSVLPLIGLLSLLIKVLRGTPFKTQNTVLLTIGIVVWSIALYYGAGYGLGMGIKPKNTFVREEPILVQDKSKTLKIKLADDYQLTDEQPNNGLMLYRGEIGKDRQVCVIPRIYINRDSTLTDYKIILKKETFSRKRSLALKRADAGKLNYELTDSLLVISPEWHDGKNVWDFVIFTLEINAPMDAQIELDESLARQNYDHLYYENHLFKVGHSSFHMGY